MPDRQTGKLISAKPYSATSWATGVDMQTGRPIETPNARYIAGPSIAMPGPLGSHNSHPMSYSPATRLVYIPAFDLPVAYAPDPAYKYTKDSWNLAINSAATASPEDAPSQKMLMSMIKGYLIAWDPHIVRHTTL